MGYRVGMFQHGSLRGCRRGFRVGIVGFRVKRNVV